MHHSPSTAAASTCKAQRDEQQVRRFLKTGPSSKFTAAIIGMSVILITTLINILLRPCRTAVEGKRVVGAVHTIDLTHTGLRCCQVERNDLQSYAS
jgi:hypothetical protein